MEEQFWETSWFRTVILVLIVLLVIILLKPFVIIQPGEIGVVFSVFGGIQTDTLSEGLNLKIPIIETVYRYPTSMQVASTRFTAITKDGFPVECFAQYSYILDSTKIIDLHRKITRTDYEEYILDNYVRDMAVNYISDYDSDAIYHGPAREEIINKITSRIYKTLYKEFYIHTKKVTIDYQVSDEYKKEMDKANLLELQLQQKQREAEAIALRNTVINDSLSTEVLQLKAIEKWDGVLPKAVGNGSGYPVTGVFEK